MSIFARTEPQTDDERREEAMRDKSREVFHEGRYLEAFNLFQTSALDTALRWLREEGLAFSRPKGTLAPLELLWGMAVAGDRLLTEQGEEASNKVSAACWLLQAVAEMRLALEEKVPQTNEAVSAKMAELVTRGVMLGQIDMIMNAIGLGWLDKLADYEVTKERRRAGAKLVNERRATAKQNALGEAIRIASRNSTLSNEELARKVIDASGLATTIRTATDWVREWRRRGYVLPITAT